MGWYKGGVPVDLFGSGVNRLRWKKADIHLGTSGYSFPDWKGTFYPENISGSRMLEFYAGHFDSVEINSSYYRIMSRKKHLLLLKNFIRVARVMNRSLMT